MPVNETSAPAGTLDTSHCVIGSGPSGVACAQALLARGAHVTMLDAGLTLEPARQQWLARMQATTPAAWDEEDLRALKAGMEASANGIPLKLAYGSDYPYRECAEHLPVDYDGTGLRPSFAQGGLSSAWGAAMLPYSERDVAGWPITIADLAPHYSAVAQLTGLSAVADDLKEFFPLHGARPAALELSRQAKLVLANLERNRAGLRQAGVHFGRARLAVRVQGALPSSGCVYCGLCLYGCPYGHIYNAANTLHELQQATNFTYQPDIVVTRLRETRQEILIEGHHRISRQPFAARAARAYLAAGVIPTARIVLGSMALYDQPLRLQDSQYFVLPLLLTRSVGDVRRESLLTLSQLFVELFDSRITRHSVHLQVYSYNEWVSQAVRATLGPLARPLEPLARSLERRLLIVQGYLHANDSPQISVALQRGTPERLYAKAEPNPGTRPTINRVVRKLLRHRRDFGAWPLAPMLQVAQAGRGFHSGGTFPMSSNPAALQSDTLGRPQGWRRLHLVDASVLPEIAATQITFSVMANAHRIGWHSVNLD